MSIKGYPSIKKLIAQLTGYTDKQSQTTNEFITAQKTSSDKVVLDVGLNGAFRVNASAKLAEVGSTNAKRILKSTAHGALPGDVIRFELGSANPFFEVGINSVPDANTIILSTELPNNIVPVTDTFFILRHVTPAYSSDGTVQSSSGPVQYSLNGTNTTVALDTVTPSNSRPLPTVTLNIDGTRVDVATAARQDTQTTALGTLNTSVNTLLKPASTLAGVTTVSTVSAVTAITNALPSGTNSIGQVTANAGTNLNTSSLNLESTQTAMSAKLPATLGQKTMANSLAVAIASDQTSVPVTSSIVDSVSSGTITTQNLVPAGTATVGSATSSGSINGAATGLIQVTGTYTGALSLQFTVDGTNWITAGGTPFLNIATGVLSATIPSASVGIYQVEVAGANNYRVTALAAVTGTAVVSLRTSRASGMIAIDTALPTGANVIGALVANQAVNISQVNGVTPLMGAGATGTGSARVTTANVAAATLANVASSATNVTLLASSAARMGATFHNDSSAILYLKFGATALTTSYTVKLIPDAYYELPQPCYSGIIDGIWSSATGAVRVTSW